MNTYRVTTRRAMLALLLAVPVIMVARPAFAQCHIAAFTDDSVSVNENAGQVTLTVELLGGQPPCSGTVQYQTVNGTATAGSDYTARQGTLSFSAGDDRRESISVPIINDTADEPDERFTVRLSGGTGNISADDTATVTIADNDPAPPPATSSPPPQGPTAQPSETETPSPAASPSPSPTPSPSPSPTPSETPTVQAAPAADTGGSNTGAIAGIVAALAVLAGVGIWLIRKRAAR